MISPTSRYANSTVSVVHDPLRGLIQVMNVEPPADRTFAFTFYQVVQGDTVDSLAYTMFGQGQLWWILADANPEILDWHSLAPGTVLRVPYV